MLKLTARHFSENRREQDPSSSSSVFFSQSENIGTQRVKARIALIRKTDFFLYFFHDQSTRTKSSLRSLRYRKLRRSRVIRVAVLYNNFYSTMQGAHVQNHLGIDYDVQRTTRVACVFARYVHAESHERFVREHGRERDEKQEESPREHRSLNNRGRKKSTFAKGFMEVKRKRKSVNVR